MYAKPARVKKARVISEDESVLHIDGKLVALKLCG